MPKSHTFTQNAKVAHIHTKCTQNAKVRDQDEQFFLKMPVMSLCHQERRKRLKSMRDEATIAALEEKPKEM
jgi:hypothetical protein